MYVTASDSVGFCEGDLVKESICAQSGDSQVHDVHLAQSTIHLKKKIIIIMYIRPLRTWHIVKIRIDFSTFIVIRTYIILRII